MKTYLRQITDFGVTNYLFYDAKNLKSIEFCKIANNISIETKNYKTIEDLQDSIQRDYRQDAITTNISRQEFNEVYANFVSNELNKIGKEL